MTFDDIVTKVAKELDLDKNIVSNTYKSYWFFIRDTIQSLPFKNDLSKEEFLKLRTNFNIPSLGKLSCTYDRYIGMKNKYKERND